MIFSRGPTDSKFSLVSTSELRDALKQNMQLYLDEETRNIVHAVYRDLYYVDYLEQYYLKYLEKYDSRVKEKGSDEAHPHRAIPQHCA
jgi:hypothetical protein